MGEDGDFIAQLLREILMGRDESPEAQPASRGAGFLRDLLTTGIFGFLQDEAREFQRDPLSTRASATAFERGRPALGALLAAAGVAGMTPTGRGGSGVIRGALRGSEAVPSRPATRSQALQDFLDAGSSAEELARSSTRRVGTSPEDEIRRRIIEDFLTGGRGREAANLTTEELIRDRLLTSLMGGR